jgi:NAD+ synthase (glutamine-hydrolysing)
MIPDKKKMGFFRAGVCSPCLILGNPLENARIIIEEISKGADAGCELLLFPELCLTGYSCGDLFYRDTLLKKAEEGLSLIARACAEKSMAVTVGLPVCIKGRLYNCAALVDASGAVQGIVPKVFLPNSLEFYEARWFASGMDLRDEEVELCGGLVPAGTDLLFQSGAAMIGIELCEDLWSVKPPSLDQALAWANVLLNLSASNEIVGKASYRRELVRQQSARCLAAYLYASAGAGESSSDVVYSGHCMIAEAGVLLTESNRHEFTSEFITSDLDLQKLEYDRTRNSSYRQSRPDMKFRVKQISTGKAPADERLVRRVDPHPFIPSNKEELEEHCEEILQIQSTGLARRLKHAGSGTLTLGLSGGLDSTLAVLVACRAFDQLGLDRKGIVAATMPGAGTTGRTRDNAGQLAEALRISLRTIPIQKNVGNHLESIGHDGVTPDVVYENAQARERTKILMNIANQTGGFVLGTGDLSELALGWCTFNGDHMSMYHVNAGVPKTLVASLVRWVATVSPEQGLKNVLTDILATPISPELIPVGKNGETTQRTENILGPYELHDFFLFQFVRCGCSFEKIAFLAEIAFQGVYDSETIDKTLNIFFRRFINQQFKRNAMPDGPKVGSVALSPRGDWRMPSDLAWRENTCCTI